jgi:hypothetical protein
MWFHYIGPRGAHDGDGVELSLFLTVLQAVSSLVWEEVVYKTDYYRWVI